MKYWDGLGAAAAPDCNLLSQNKRCCHWTKHSHRGLHKVVIRLSIGLHRSPGRFLRRASGQAGVERITHSATGHSVNQESPPSRISFPATDSPVHGLSVIASAGDVHVSAYIRVVRKDHSHSHAGADLRTADALHESLRRVTVVGRFFRSGPISCLRTKNNASRA
jgi:hypothetical protein